MIIPDNFAQRVKSWIRETASIKVGLARYGQDLIQYLCGQADSPMSLRELARRSGLSPTYLSRAMNSEVNVSSDAYLKIYRVYQEHKNY